MAKKKPRVNKRLLWFKHYTDESNPATFMNKLGAAKAAGYKAKTENAFGCIGVQNYKKLQNEVLQWLDDIGLSETYLKQKLLSLIETKKTIFQKIKGHSDLTELHGDVFEIAKTHKMAWSGQGEEKEAFDDGETLIAINIEDPEIQRKTLDMALKVKGLYAPEKLEHTGNKGRPIEYTIVSKIPEPDPPPKEENGNSDSSEKK